MLNQTNFNIGHTHIIVINKTTYNTNEAVNILKKVLLSSYLNSINTVDIIITKNFRYGILHLRKHSVKRSSVNSTNTYANKNIIYINPNEFNNPTKLNQILIHEIVHIKHRQINQFIRNRYEAKTKVSKFTHFIERKLNLLMRGRIKASPRLIKQLLLDIAEDFVLEGVAKIAEEFEIHGKLTHFNRHAAEKYSYALNMYLKQRQYSSCVKIIDEAMWTIGYYMIKDILEANPKSNLEKLMHLSPEKIINIHERSCHHLGRTPLISLNSGGYINYNSIIYNNKSN